MKCRHRKEERSERRNVRKIRTLDRLNIYVVRTGVDRLDKSVREDRPIGKISEGKHGERGTVRLKQI